ncbi:hypothetical protein FCIRC_5897 [Fusarium circinatum]|uniref:Uncharacterized protein n=1 Tax=Fusarium circinatum TaxID=48490 RepID=A0A8H5U2P0_FUSCI|nr:hypothetical protein FCIRC_5897 [Fusarium circinatum]
MAGDWDASAISAVAALIVALFALLVAAAQALQQYLITGQLIRLCDSVVFGPLPGQGYRVWQFSQFRFRVLYSIPQINLEADLWPKESPHIKAYAIGSDMLPDLQPDSLIDYSASSSSVEIVSDYRVHVHRTDRSRFTYWGSLRLWLRRKFNTKGSGISRTSSDSWGPPTPPDYSYWNLLRIWLRQKFARVRSLPEKERPASISNDASVGEASWVSFCKAIMGLTAGMKITDCSFRDKSISMQGAIGTITSSNHPILGPILHFTPRAITSPIPRLLAPWSDDDRGVVNPHWLSRTWDVCTVAKVYFGSLKRRTTRRLDTDGLVIKSLASTTGIRDTKERSTCKKPGKTGPVSVSRRPQDGNWSIIEPPVPAQAATTEANENKEKVQDQGGTGEGNREHAAPVPQSASVAELNSKEQDMHQELSRNDLTSQQAKPFQKTPAMHPIESANLPQHGAKGKGHSDDVEEIPIPEPLVKGKQIAEEPTLKEEGESQSRIISLEPDELNVAAPQISGEGFAAIFGRPVTRLLLTQTSHWDTVPEENPQDTSHQEPDIRQPRRRVTVEDVPDSGDEVASESGRPLGPGIYDRGLAAKKRQEKRNKRSRKIQKDKAIVEESGTSDARSQFLLTYSGEGPASEPTPETKEDKAHAREAERRRRREEREIERDRRNKSRGNVVSLNRMDMYWFCQVDIYQGFWATPWRADAPIDTSLVGAVTVILEALLGFLEENVSLVYCNPSRFHTTRDWITHGGITYPAYASNSRGGVIARGSYKGVKVPAFQYSVPALELLYSYEWQVSSYLHDQERYCEDLNIELMRIDAWLSYVGRTERITNGPTDLLKGAPALVQLLQADFEVDFMNIDLSAKEGGHQDIQGLADNVMDFLTDEELDEAEQLHILVAMLRAVKVFSPITNPAPWASDLSSLDQQLSLDITNSFCTSHPLTEFYKSPETKARMKFYLFSGVSNQPSLPENPQSEPFELIALPGPDIWRTPSCAGGRDDFNGPIYATPLPLSSFKSAKVTISSEFPGNYSQGGLILFMAENIPLTQTDSQLRLEKSPRTWIKAGIENVDGEFFASVAAAKPYSDWSLVRLGESCATFEMEKVKGSLWIYVTGSDGRRTPVRKLTWVVDVAPEYDIWIGVAACMPKGDESQSGGMLKVQFRDFSVTTE